jgi:flagellar hook-associated protein 2
MSSVLPTGSTSGTSTSSPSTSSSLAALAQGVVSSLGKSGTISSTGLGSGLDINSIVQQLVSAEGTPRKQLLTDQQTRLQTQISAYGQLQTAISGVETALVSLATPQAFEGATGTVADKTVATVTTDSSATPGSYSLLVTQLAQGAKLESAPLANANTAVGTGTLSIAVGSHSFNVAIGSSNDTLAGIAAAINLAAAGSGLSAALVTTNAGTSLVLNSATTGAANAVSVTETDSGAGLASLTYAAGGSSNGLTQLQGAQDAIVKLDGNAYNSASNVVTGLLTGVTLSLAGISSGTTPTTLSISTDTAGSEDAVTTFVSAYNAFAQTVKALSSYNPATKTGGPLLGNALLTNLISQINNAVDSKANMPAGSPFTTLAELGIVANPDGTLTSDTAKLSTAFTNSFSAVANLFAGSGGIAAKLNSLLTTFTQPQGILAQKNNSLQQGLKSVADQTTALNQHLATMQASLLAQYNAMDALVAQLKATGTAASAQLASIYYPGEAQTPVP